MSRSQKKLEQFLENEFFALILVRVSHRNGLMKQKNSKKNEQQLTNIAKTQIISAIRKIS